jgi:hypothetical protein
MPGAGMFCYEGWQGCEGCDGCGWVWLGVAESVGYDQG